MGPCVTSPLTGSTSSPNPGKTVAIATKNKMMWTSSGMFRMYSMKALASLATSQLLESRPMPIKVPRTVASAMPAIAIRMVLTMPTQSARPLVAGSVSIPSPRAMSGSTSRKSKPVWMDFASRFSPASPTRKTRAKMTAARVASWANHLTMVESR